MDIPQIVAEFLLGLCSAEYQELPLSEDASLTISDVTKAISRASVTGELRRLCDGIQDIYVHGVECDDEIAWLGCEIAFRERSSPIALALRWSDGAVTNVWVYDLWYRTSKPEPSAVIVTYHRFGDTEASRQALESHCRALSTGYSLLPLDCVQRHLDQGSGLAVAVTVDDGYLDAYSVAFPLFRSYGIPATVFLVSDFVDGRLWLWTDQLECMCDTAPAQITQVKLHAGQIITLDLTSQERRLQTRRRLSDELKTMPDEARRRLIEELPRILESSLPPSAPEKYRSLNWNQAGEMSEHNIKFGAHTRTHPILSRIGDDDVLLDEVTGSRRRISEMLARPITSFAYPNGRREDIGERARRAVASSGIQTAVTTIYGPNGSGGDPLLLRRVYLEPCHAVQLVKLRIGGVQYGSGVSVREISRSPRGRQV